MILKRKTMFDILKEADDDNTTADTNTEEPATDAGSSDTNDAETSTDNNDTSDADGATDDNFGGEDDFNINTSLDDSGDDSGSDSTSNTDTGSTDTGGEESEETPKEVIQTNANIFNSLTKEEQEIKIRELKKLFNELYSSTDDIVQKINNIPTDESSILTINRIAKTLANTKEYIRDYLLYSFTSKSFVENDVMFNRFLVILNSISGIIDKMYNQNQ